MGKKGRILVVEDDETVAAFVGDTLSMADYGTCHAPTAAAALKSLKRERPDLLLLDVGLPDISGFELLKTIRGEPATASLPVIMLTGLADEAHKLQGLQWGADDYMVKPFSPRELLARVAALLRRAGVAGCPAGVMLEAGCIRMNLEQREAWSGKHPLPLTSTEFELLAIFMRYRGHVLTYEVLGGALIHNDAESSSDTVYAHVNNIRKKLGNCARLIETVRGIGYRFADHGSN